MEPAHKFKGVAMNQPDFLRRVLIVAVVAVLAVTAMLLTINLASILVLAFACWIISLGLTIPINFFRRRGLSRGQAIAVTFVLSTLALVLFVLILLPPLLAQIVDLVQSFPAAIQAAIRNYNQFRGEQELLASLLPPVSADSLRDFLESTQQAGFDPSQIAQVAVPVLINTGNFIFNAGVSLFLVFFISLYLVIDPLIYYRMVIVLVPKQHEARALDILNKLRRTIIVWIGAMALEVTITALMVMFALGVILQIPNAIALGVLAGLGNIVPYIGYWVALTPIIIFAAASSGPLAALLAFILYFIIGIIEANIILPANIKGQLNIPAALTLVSQIVAAALFGLAGVLLAVPLVAVLMLLVRELYVIERLGKTGPLTDVAETPDGLLVLQPPPEAANAEQSG